MSTNHTTNYDLNQWEGTDKVLRAEFNADNAKIDAALKANADAIAAEAAAREAGVSGKADQSALTALSQTVAGKGNCQMEWVTYTGNGGGTLTLAFSRKPACFLVIAESGLLMADCMTGRGLSLFYDSIVHGAGIGGLSVSWDGSAATLELSGLEITYCNESGTTYHALAFFAMGTT